MLGCTKTNILKKFMLVLIMSYAFCVNAQDNIILRNGDELKGKVLEMTNDFIKFKPSDNPNGPDYLYKKSEVFMIKYENGKKEVFNDPLHSIQPTDYSTVEIKEKFNESVFAYLIRIGWEYGHSVYSYSNYYGYPYTYYVNNFARTENNFYIDILAGTRSKHYQFAGGIGFYFQNLHWKSNYFDNSFGNFIDTCYDYQGIAVPLIFSNKVYFNDKNITPFILGDMSWVFTNVFPITGANQNNNNYYDFDSNHFDLVFGVGVELKSTKKYKTQIEFGFRTKTGYTYMYKKSSFHSGLSIVF